MNRRKFISGAFVGGMSLTAGCTTITGDSDEYANPAEVSIQLRNSRSTDQAVQLLIESTSEYIHWETYNLNSSDSEIVDIEIPDDKQFVSIHVQHDDSTYTADFSQWRDIDGNCGSVIFEIRDNSRETDLYYSTQGVGQCDTSAEE